jgi:hypothetical protein
VCQRIHRIEKMVKIHNCSINWFFANMVMVAINWVQIKYYLIPKMNEFFVFSPDDVFGLEQIKLVWSPIVTYLLLATNMVFISGIFKRSKSTTEKKLIQQTFFGLVCVFIGGLVFGPFMGLENGFYFGFIFGLACGFIWWITFLFTCVLVGGLIDEFT